MRARTLFISLGLTAVVLFGAACNPPQPNHPMAGKRLYMCCNMRYEKDEVSDNWFLVGNLVKIGTPVQILEVRKDSVKFQPDGHPAITLKFKYGEEAHASFDQYLERVFVERNPTSRFGKKLDKMEAAVMDGRIEKGMTRDQVTMAIGYPPAHRTASLDSDVWSYWENRWHQYTVSFQKGRVDRISR